MRTLADDLKVQSSISLQSVKFHQTKFVLIDSVLKESSYPFCDTSKQVLLIICKEVTEWFNELSILTSMYGNVVFTEDVLTTLIEDFKSIVFDIAVKVKLYCKEADDLILEDCNVIFNKQLEGLVPVLRKKLALPASTAFADLNNFIVSFIHYTKKVVHEIDYIRTFTGRESFDPFISIDALDMMIFQETGVSTPLLRLEAYKDSKQLTVGPICVKSYIDAYALDNSKQLSDAFEYILESIKSADFKLLCII